MPLFFIFLKNGLSFININGSFLLKSNTNFAFHEVMTIMILFFIPNLLFIAFISFIQNIYLLWKNQYNKHQKIKPHEITSLGIHTPLLYEVLNYATMVFFFLINVLEIENHTKNEVIFFLYFYCIVFELKFCKFNKKVYKNINILYKMIFLFDYLIIVFISGEVYLELVLPFLVIEVFSMFFLLIGLISFYYGFKRLSNLVFFGSFLIWRNQRIMNFNTKKLRRLSE